LRLDSESPAGLGGGVGGVVTTQLRTPLRTGFPGRRIDWIQRFL
jgi:hypothetical protein